MIEAQALRCYVSMPFGRKTDAQTGQEIDFDAIYAHLIQPAAVAVGVLPYRSDELLSRGVIMRAIMEAILSSDVMIADLTLGNANVYYELGLRHMSQPAHTLLIQASGKESSFNVSGLPVLFYPLNAAGQIDSDKEEEFRMELQRHIKMGLERPITDSPVYQFFPELQPPTGLASSSSMGRELLEKSEPPFKAVKQHLQQVRKTQQFKLPDERVEALREIEQQIQHEDDDYADLSVELLLSYRDESSWDEMVRLYDSFPSTLQNRPVVLQQTALALNRLGDRERAEYLLKEYVAATGGDSEAFGLLGRIYKDRYRDTGAADDLNHAIEAYRKGFEADSRDYYPGVNLVTLLQVKGDEASHEQMQHLLPQLRAILDERTREGPVGYWEIATSLELDVLARDWDQAQQRLGEVRRRAAASWMIETTAHNLRLIAKHMNERDQQQLSSIIDQLTENAFSKGTYG